MCRGVYSVNIAVLREILDNPGTPSSILEDIATPCATFHGTQTLHQECSGAGAIIDLASL